MKTTKVEKGLRRKRDAGRDAESKVKQREGRRSFQREGPMVPRDLVWACEITITISLNYVFVLPFIICFVLPFIICFICEVPV